jgi:hypothetical protein
MLSPEKSSVDRPGARPDHRQRAAEDRKHQRHPEITPACENNPQLNCRDQRSYHGCPQTSQDEDPQRSAGYLRNRLTGRRGFQLRDPNMQQSDSREEPLNEKAESRPAIREC